MKPESSADTTGTSLARLLLSIDSKKCAFACTYCFTDFSQYEMGPTLASVEEDPSLLEGVDVIYPACDTDIFSRDDYDSTLSRVAALSRSVSISTKAGLNSGALSALKRLYSTLGHKGKVLKVGVSFSTKFSVASIEPKTPGYAARQKSLRSLQRAGIASAVVLRPLLAEISDREYEEILRDSLQYTNNVLVGEEWLDEDRPRQAIGADASPEISVQRVNWLGNQPEWSQRAIPGRVQALRTYAESLGYRFFESDLDLMACLTDETVA